MKRIDNSTATEDDKFTDGNPGSGTPATVVSAQWLNVIQEEIAHVIEEAGGTLDQTGADTTQLYDAVAALIAASVPVDTDTDSFAEALLHVRDEKAAGTDGGTSATSFVVRTLNTVKKNLISGASLASNKITLPAGDYIILASAPCYNSGSHIAKLYNQTDAADIIIGTVEVVQLGNVIQSRSFVHGFFTLAGTKDLEIRHRADQAEATFGWGVSASFSVVEVYTDVMIWKVG